MSEEDDVVGIRLRVVGTYDAQECGFSCPILARESPAVAVTDSQREVFQYGAGAVSDVHVVEADDVVAVSCYG